MRTIFPSTSIAKAELLSFCAAIDMPEEVRDQVADCVAQTDLAAYDRHFTALLSPGSAAEDAAAFKEAVPEKGGWVILLTAHLTAALHNKPALYDARGISDGVFRDTMDCFPRFVREHKESSGSYGFDRSFWSWRQINGLLFRLGTLEFEMVPLGKTGLSRIQPPPAAEGAPILSVHIPSDAALTRQALSDSYRQARDFFRRYFPSYPYALIGCASWLLAPKLRGLLGPDSGILRFQADYDVLYENPEADDATVWVFKRSYENPGEMPEDTSLQRKIKALMLSGGHLGSGAGVLRENA